MATTVPRILCVDDEPEILKFFESLLALKGYEVTKALNGEEALQKLREERVDLVITDLKMPKMDGFELCRTIKEDEEYRTIPVIMITALSDREDRVKGIEAGAEDFLSKPVDPMEVLARIKMLLKAKALQERRIGELFIELGFITEEQLDEALKIAKQKSLKVGEALYSMGALDKDHIYWALSNQMSMNYVELTAEMINKDLIAQFSIDVLEQLKCLPLHETMREIHFAIADPTDERVIQEVKNLKPGKAVQLHLALPQKIVDILDFFKEEFCPSSEWREMVRDEKHADRQPTLKKAGPQGSSRSEPFWNDLVTLLFSLSQGERCWVYKNSPHCLLICQKGRGFEPVLQYPEEVYPLIKEQFQQEKSSQDPEGNALFFLQERPTGRGNAFEFQEMDFLGKKMLRIGPIPSFSKEELWGSHSQAPGLIKDLEHLVSEHSRLLIGSKEGSFVKQCCYAMLEERDRSSDFPPPFFLEKEIGTYFPKAAQISRSRTSLARFLEQFKETSVPFLFCETELTPMTSEDQNLLKFFSRIDGNVILSVPFPSPEAMQEALNVTRDWGEAGFKALFHSFNRFKPI